MHDNVTKCLDLALTLSSLIFQRANYTFAFDRSETILIEKIFMSFYVFRKTLEYKDSTSA